MSLAALMTLVTCLPVAGAPDDGDKGEAKALTEIRRLGGQFTRAERRAGKPVVEVNLNDTDLTDAGLAHLKGLTRLQILDLAYTRMTNAGVAKLNKALPHLRISGQ
jgi:hypothetical protein